MILYSKVENWIAYIDTDKQTCDITDDIDTVFDDHKRDIFVTFNGEAEKKKYPNHVIFSAYPDRTFIDYCNEKGYNIATDNHNRDRACYNLYMIAKYFEDIIMDRFTMYTKIISQYKLKPICYRYSTNQLMKEVLGWK